MKYAGTIEIDGQKFNYNLTPANGTSVANSSGMRTVPGSPAANEQSFEIMVLAHSVKSDIGKNGKPYNRHAFKGSDNRTYVTFRDAVASELQPHVGSGEPIRIIGEQTKFGVDIVRVEA